MFKTHTFARSLVATAAFWVAGCASPIHVVVPTPGENSNPVTSVKVSFDDSKYVEDWHVNLDGAKLSGFSPVPPPGHPPPGFTSTAQIAFSFTGGAEHALETVSSCGFACAWNSEKVVFTPPRLLVLKGDATDYSKQPAFLHSAAGFHSVKVVIQHPASVDIVVTLQEGTVNQQNGQINPPPKPKVTLDYLPPGAPTTAVIPKGSREALFTILKPPGVGGGGVEFNLGATAAGCQAITIVGNTDT